MRVLHSVAELGEFHQRACLAIGVFDGVHLGHRQVIGQTISDSRQYESQSVVVTFDRHPSAIVAPARAPLLIYSLIHKLRVMEELGVDAVLVLPFDEKLSQIPGEQFIRNLSKTLPELQSISVGSNFTFGHKRSGDVNLLRRLGAELGFRVHGLAAVGLDNERVSSTRIRDAINVGDLDAASQMLGRSYALCGTVIQGDQIGRKLGFPTANMDVEGLATPPRGVYVVHAVVAGHPVRGVLNLGIRPTLNEERPVLRAEVHLLDFKEKIYGKELQVTFVSRLRGEQAFPSLEALREQISRDVAAARATFGSEHPSAKPGIKGA